MLNTFNLKVDTVESGEKALALINNRQHDDPYAIIIMDWQMEGMDGIETVKAIEKLHLQSPPKIILATAYCKDEATDAAEDINISTILTKPVTPSSLFNAIMIARGYAIATDEHTWKHSDSLTKNISRLRGARLLLVEDNEINQELTLDLLASNGMAVEIAGNGKEALEKLAQNDFDGILMDCQMPVMDGYEATRQLRQQDRLKDLPVLAMTANAMAGDREKVLQAGMNDHIAKPINVEEMFQRMAQWITPAQGLQEDIKKKTTAELEIPPLTGINTEDGLARTQGNSNLYLNLLHKFFSSQQDVMVDFKAAQQAGNWQLAERLAHTLKGIAGNIGPEQLGDCCAALEKQAKKKQIKPATISKTENALMTVLQSISPLTYADNKHSPLTGLPNKEKLQEILGMLSRQIERFDTQALATLDNNRELFTADTISQKSQSLEEALHNYDFENALIICTALQADMTNHQQKTSPEHIP
jgi:CheY-like chemotaxis protein/HPt (histidine-containing phosphotransfer) domain-containing protein